MWLCQALKYLTFTSNISSRVSFSNRFCPSTCFVSHSVGTFYMLIVLVFTVTPRYTHKLGSWTTCSHRSIFEFVAHASYTHTVYRVWHSLPSIMYSWLYYMTLCTSEIIWAACTLYMHVHESSSLTWMGPNQHLLAPQTHNPFLCHLASLTLVQLGIHQS